MSIKKLYIQQTSYDGSAYQKGAVVDIFDTYHVAISDIPYKRLPEIKDPPKRDWKGADGVDVYIPHPIPIKDYDIEISMLYKGSEDHIKEELDAFVDYLYGRNAGAKGGRLFLYDEYTQTGWKDVYALSVTSEDYYASDDDPDALCAFNVKFHVSDPATAVTPVRADGIVTDLIY